MTYCCPHTIGAHDVLLVGVGKVAPVHYLEEIQPFWHRFQSLVGQGSALRKVSLLCGLLPHVTVPEVKADRPWRLLGEMIQQLGKVHGALGHEQLVQVQ